MRGNRIGFISCYTDRRVNIPLNQSVYTLKIGIKVEAMPVPDLSYSLSFNER